MKRTDIAYTAGIIDGEGCIIIHKVHSYYQLTVSVSSIDEWLPRWLAFAWGGNCYKRTQSQPNQKPAWEWHIASRMARNLLESILPYLHIKQPQAEIAIAFQKTRGRKGKTKILSDTERAISEAQKVLISKMNQREGR